MFCLMKDNEFNDIKITNEDEHFVSEFSPTQNNESTSYPDNKIDIKDEVNDNVIFNSANKEEKKRKKENDSSQESRLFNPPSSGGTHLGPIGVAGAVVVTVVAISTLVGINLYYSGKCDVNFVKATSNTISYDLNVSIPDNNVFVLKVENSAVEYSVSSVLTNGDNTGTLEGLEPETPYTLTVIDTTHDNYVLYESVVITHYTCEVLTMNVDDTYLYYELYVDAPSDDLLMVKLENPDRQFVMENEISSGQSEGAFEELDPETTYLFSVISQSHNDFVIYSQYVTTKEYSGPTIYTVKFYDISSSTLLDTQEVIEGECCQEITSPSREGYKFLGWSKDYFDGELFDFETPIYSSFTLYAQWKKLPSISEFGWDYSTIDFKNYQINYYLNYTDPDNELSDLTLTLSYTEPTAGELKTQSFPLDIAEGAVVCDLDVDFENFELVPKKTYSYEISYVSPYEENPIILNQGETVINDSHDRYLIMNNINIVYYDYDQSDLHVTFRWGYEDSLGKTQTFNFFLDEIFTNLTFTLSNADYGDLSINCNKNGADAVISLTGQTYDVNATYDFTFTCLDTRTNENIVLASGTFVFTDSQISVNYTYTYGL